MFNILLKHGNNENNFTTKNNRTTKSTGGATFNAML